MNLLLLLLIVATQPLAPIESRHPDAVEVFHCGFEEAMDKDANFWPDGWTRKKGPNFPAYLPIKIVEAETPEGHYALRIGLNGNAGCVSTPPIEVGSLFSYVLEGTIRTEGLKHDRAFISLSLRDGQGKVLETFVSEQIESAAEGKKIRLGPLVATSEQVRSAVISLHLEPIGDMSDLRGCALFDDIWLGRLPRMSLTTNRADNVYMVGAPIEIQCKVSGIFERNPLMRCEVVDVDGQPVGEPFIRRMENKPSAALAPRDKLLSTAAAEQDKGFVDSLRWKPVITEPGFYRAHVVLEGSTEKVLERQLTLAVIEPRRVAVRGEFGWTLGTGDRPLPYSVLVQLLPQMGLSWAKFPVWLSAKRVEKLDELVDFAERLSLQGVESVGILADPPEEVRPHFGDTPTLTAAAIFSTDPEIWYTSLEPATTRLSLQMHWWQLGHDDDLSFLRDPQLAKRVGRVKKQLEQFGQTAHIGLPWRVLNELPDDRRPPWDFFNLGAEPSLTQDELAAYLPAIDPQKGSRWIALEPLPRDDYALKDRASDLVHRMVAAKQQGANAIFVPNPFNDRTGLMNEDGTPGELLLPWRTTANALSGAKYLGSVILPEGSNNQVFSRDGEIVMVIWNSRPVEERVFLGENIRQLDLWGRGVKPREDEHNHVISVGTLPSFLVGLSEPIVRWNMEFAFEKSQLPSIFGTSHSNAVRIKNFFPQGAAGQVRLNTPEVWKTLPRVIGFKLAAGEELHEPFTIQLPVDATNGHNAIRVDFQITADRDYQFSVYRDLEVGLGDVVIEMSSHLNAQGELEVEQFFTNKTDQLVSFKCSLYAPDRRRLVSQVTRLGPHRDTKRYRFPNGKELIGKTISLRAEEIGGERTFNYRFIAKE
jgi:hypothetical protein